MLFRHGKKKTHQQKKLARKKKRADKVKNNKQKANQRKTSMKQRWHKISKMAADTAERFNFGRHRKMEHIRDQFFIVIMIMVIGMVGGYYHNRNYLKQQAETLTSYSSHVSFSHTNSTSLDLHKIQLSGNRRTAYIPFSFNSMASIPYDANEYTVLVGAVDGHMAHPVSGQMILFGTTARGAVLIHSNHRIANQPIEVIIRDDKNLNLDGEGGDGSNQNPNANNAAGIQQYEQKYNALDFKVNPGAKRVKRNPKLGTHDKLSSVYYQLNGRNDMKDATNDDQSARKGIRRAFAVSHEYESRLKHLGFHLPKYPKWLKKKWRPYDALRKDGVPRNKKNSLANRKNVKEDAAYSPVDNSNDTVDSVQFPGSLKKKDGTTTSDQNNSQVTKSDNSDNDTSSDGTHANINGGNVTNPSQMWETLQQAWDDILQYKHDIYSINASTIFKIHATVKQMSRQSSVGHENHFHDVN